MSIINNLNGFDIHIGALQLDLVPSNLRFPRNHKEPKTYFFVFRAHEFDIAHTYKKHGR